MNGVRQSGGLAACQGVGALQLRVAVQSCLLSILSETMGQAKLHSSWLTWQHQ